MARGRSRKQGDFGVFTAWSEPSPERPPINRERLVSQALSLLDEVGFDGLTMRRLAERLGIQAASLYNHVRDKHELLAHVADAICGEIREPDAHRPWREQLESLAWDYRRVLLAHRDAARVLVATPPVGPKRLLLIDRTLAAFRSAGFDNMEIANATSVLNTYVTGFVLDETQALPGGDLPDMPTDEISEQFKRWFKALPANRYPNIAALADQLLDVDMDRRFGFGLRALLDGWEMLAAPERGKADAGPTPGLGGSSAPST